MVNRNGLPPIHFPDSLSSFPFGGAQKHSFPFGGAQKHLRATRTTSSLSLLTTTLTRQQPLQRPASRGGTLVTFDRGDLEG